MPRPIHFEIHAENKDRAQRFYEELLGWTFEQWGGDMYRLIDTGQGQGINGGMTQRRGPAPAENAPVASWVCTVDVDNVDSYVEKAQALGGAVAVPKMPVPGIGWLAYVKDTEGNIFGMMQPDTSAG
jgi:predicted enzyme related to lactoylglutathione lyase